MISIRTKYDPIPMGESEPIEHFLAPDEQLLIKAKPKKNAYIINKISAMAPFALLWLLFDGGAIAAMILSGVGAEFQMSGGLIIIICFFALHLMPVWIWIGQILTASSRWKNEEYAMTTHRILIKNGFVGMSYDSVYYKDIIDANLRIQIVDKLLGVGDIMFTTTRGDKAFLDIENATSLYQQVQRIIVDMSSDMYYPNALRPESNPGYKPQYINDYVLRELENYK